MCTHNYSRFMELKTLRCFRFPSYAYRYRYHFLNRLSLGRWQMPYFHAMHIKLPSNGVNSWFFLSSARWIHIIHATDAGAAL